MTARALRGAAGWGAAIAVLAGLPHLLPVYHQFVAS